MFRVCFVCLGNICRSPQAEGIFLDLVRRAGLQDRVEVDSAGTGAWHVGEPADPRTLAASRRHGIELPSRARQFAAGDLDRFDLVLALDAANLGNLKRLEAEQRVRSGQPVRAELRLLRAYDPDADDPSVPDPYAGSGDGFERVFQMCRVACERLLVDVRGRLG